MATKKPRSVLTTSQQSHVRANMMRTAALIAHQLGQYTEHGTLTVAGREIPLTTERLAAWRMVLERTIPTLSSTEVKHTSALEGMATQQLINRLATLARTRPDLQRRLQEALGGMVIDAAPESAAVVPIATEGTQRASVSAPSYPPTPEAS